VQGGPQRASRQSDGHVLMKSLEEDEEGPRCRRISGNTAAHSHRAKPRYREMKGELKELHRERRAGETRGEREGNSMTRSGGSGGSVSGGGGTNWFTSASYCRCLCWVQASCDRDDDTLRSCVRRTQSLYFRSIDIKTTADCAMGHFSGCLFFGGTVRRHNGIPPRLEGRPLQAQCHVNQRRPRVTLRSPGTSCLHLKI